MAGLTPAEAWTGTIDLDSVRVTQLEPGEMTLDRTATDLGSLRCVSLSTGVAFKGRSDLLPGRTLIGITADPSADARWFGAALDSAHIVQTQSSMDLTMHGRSSMYFVAVDTEKLDLDNASHICRNANHAAALRSNLEAAVHLSRRSTAEEERLRSIEETLPHLLHICLSQSGPLSGSVATRRRVAAVRTCEEYVLAHLDDNPTLAELCAVAEMRARSLCNAFLAVTGMTPMTYLRVHRLNGVRQALLARGDSKIRIMDVAVNWGFWHMGHFTMTYRKMFGESPSETLNRRL